MASPTRLLKRRRSLSQINQGKRRKAAERIYGTTQPNLPLDVPNANELAQKKRDK